MSATQTAHSAAVQLLPLAKELDENKVTPGVLGFLVFAVIGLAVWFLMKSMNRHMKRVDFEEKPAGTGPGTGPGSEGPAGSGPKASGAGAKATKAAAQGAKKQDAAPST